MNDIPEEVCRWAKGIVEKNLRVAKGLARGKVIGKEKHTREVVLVGKEIVDNSPEFKWNKKQAAVICYLHDIGRFPQVLSNSYSDIETGIDHASLGIKMIAQQNFPWKKWGMKGEEIMEAIKWHNQKDYLGKNIYAKFIRDADKNALFKNYKDLEDNIFFTKKKNQNIKKIIWEKLEKKETIGNEIVESSAEGFINFASWLWNLNLNYSKKMVVKSGVIEKILESLIKNRNNEEEVERVEKNMEKFRLLTTTI